MGRKKMTDEERTQALRDAQARYYAKNREAKNAKSRAYYHKHKKTPEERERTSNERYQKFLAELRGHRDPAGSEDSAATQKAGSTTKPWKPFI